jgi:hypothetical protein
MQNVEVCWLLASGARVAQFAALPGYLRHGKVFTIL